MITYAPRDDSNAIKAHRARIAALKKDQRRRRIFFFIVLGLILVIGLSSFGVARILRVKPVSASVELPVTPAEKVSIAWPAGEAAVGLSAGGILASTVGQEPAPTASVAKVITAVMVLKKHPLKAGEQGPLITMTQADVDSYYNYSSRDGSTVPVVVGEQISEYQALQALLLPSANNMADSLAIWAYGSLDAYAQAANSYVKSIGMRQTHIADDASGFSSATVSTPRDLVLLGQAALQLPILQEIVAQKTADLPIVGTVQNVNRLLDEGGLNGIKTGNTEEAGGCLLLSSKQVVQGKTITIIGAIMQSPSLEQAFVDTAPFLESIAHGFAPLPVIKKGTIIAHYQSPWGINSQVVASQDLTVIGWKGINVSLSTQTPPLTAGSSVYNGTITAKTAIDSKTIPLRLSSKLEAPAYIWRLKHFW